MRLQEAAVFCSVIGALLYLNTLDCGYCFDDHSAIEYNQDVRSETPWSQLLQNDFWGGSMLDQTSHKSYRPLTVATFRLNYMLHELQPLGYHLVNVLLHSAVCYLYVLLCGVVFSEVWPALIAGLLFAVHPIHTEAVSTELIIIQLYIIIQSLTNNTFKPVPLDQLFFYTFYYAVFHSFIWNVITLVYYPGSPIFVCLHVSKG